MAKTPESCSEKANVCWWMDRAEIDTSAPFQSVKEAVDLFGGRGSWKPRSRDVQNASGAEFHRCLEFDIAIVEEEAERLKKDIVAEEHGTLNVLKEIAMTKQNLDELKLKLCNESSEEEKMHEQSKDSMKNSDSRAHVVDDDPVQTEACCDRENLSIFLQVPSEATLQVEENNLIAMKAHEADELCWKRIEAAMIQVEEANKTKMELLKKVEEAKEDIRASRKALEEALERVKMSKHGRRRRSIHNSPRFKNSNASQRRRESRRLDVNVLCLSNDDCNEMRRPTLSIGEILRRKLLGPESFDGRNIIAEPGVSLREMLRRQRSLSLQKNEGVVFNQIQASKKRFDFKRFSLFLP